MEVGNSTSHHCRSPSGHIYFFNFTNNRIKENVYDNNIIELYCFITSVHMVSSFIDLKLTA